MRHSLSRPRRATRVVRLLSVTLPLLGGFGLAAVSLPAMVSSATSPVHPSHAARAATGDMPLSPHAPSAAATVSQSTRAAAPIQVDAVFADQVSASSADVPGMIEQVFGPYAWQALDVARCESGLAPSATNPSSGAAGVFQFLWSTWGSTSYAGYSPYDAWANINAAHEVFVRDGYSWREWTCQP